MGKEQLAIAAGVTAVGVFIGMSVYGLSAEHAADVVGWVMDQSTAIDDWATSLFTESSVVEGGP